MKIYSMGEFYVGLIWIVSVITSVMNLAKGTGDESFNIASLIGSVALMLAFLLDSTCRIPVFSIGSSITVNDIFEKSGHAIKKITMLMVRIAFYGGVGLGVLGILGLAKIGNPEFKNFAMMGGPIALLATAEFRFMVNRYIKKSIHV